jgi:hypothetical protein
MDEDYCPNCSPLGCDCSDAQRPSQNERYVPGRKDCRCGAEAAGGDCMCHEDCNRHLADGTCVSEDRDCPHARTTTSETRSGQRTCLDCGNYAPLF